MHIYSYTTHGNREGLCSGSASLGSYSGGPRLERLCWLRFEPNTSSNLLGALLCNRVHRARSPSASKFCDFLRNLSSNLTLIGRATLYLAKMYSVLRGKPLFRTFTRKTPRILQHPHYRFQPLNLSQTETPLIRSVSTQSVWRNRSEHAQTAFRSLSCRLFVIPRSEFRMRNRGPERPLRIQ
jgi:hypothetical protein